jgi:outer membrane lipoprotein LolB
LPSLTLNHFYYPKVTTLLWLGLALGLQSCAQAPVKTSQPSPTANATHLAKVATIQTYTLNGRMGLQTSGQGFSGRLHWQHTPSHDDISLFSPFGGQVAQIVKTDAQVTLTDDKGRSISASDIKTLMNKQLGWHIPVDALEDWALGRPAKTASSNPVEPQWDAQGRLQSFKQDGWAVKYKSYKQTNGYDLPSKLTLRKEGLYLKLLVETWDIQ